MKQILLNPGPANTTEYVKNSLVVDDICPREKDFGDVMKSIQNDITNFVTKKSDEYETILFSSSGTGAMEAMLTACDRDNDYTIVLSNGAYGKRAYDILQSYNIKSNIIEFDLTIDIKIVERWIQEFRDITRIFIVHSETTMGVLNDIKTIGKLCYDNEIQFLVDGMSSVFAHPVIMEECYIDYLACRSNKNMQAMAGVGIVIAKKETLLKLNSITPISYYFDLYRQSKAMADTGQMRFTPPVQLLYALKAAIRELNLETIEGRMKRYKKLSKKISNGMEKLGFIQYTPKGHESYIITAFTFHKSFPDFDDFHDFLYDNGFTIYPGKVANLNTFRIANIGELLEDDIDSFLELVKTYIKWGL